MKLKTNDLTHPGLQEFVLESPNFSGLSRISDIQWMLITVAVSYDICVTDYKWKLEAQNHITHNRKLQSLYLAKIVLQEILNSLSYIFLFT